MQDLKRAKARREGVLLAAAEVFAEKGYAAATMDDVGERYGVTKGVLYYYFRSKEEIYVQIMTTTISSAIQNLETIIARGEGPEKTFRAVVEEIASQVLERLPHYAIVLAQVTGLSRESQLRLRRMRRRFLSLIESVFRAGVSQGVFADRDPRVAVFTALSACISPTYWFDPKGPLSKETVVQQITDQVMASLVTYRHR